MQQLDTFIHTNTHLIPWAGCTATSCRRGSSLTSIAYCKYLRGPCFEKTLGTYKYVETCLKRHRRVLHMPRRLLHMRTAGNHGLHWLHPRCHVSLLYHELTLSPNAAEKEKLILKKIILRQDKNR
jgi:hypothetical protein